MKIIERKKSNRNPILVTGSHRSGTTWVGRMLRMSSEIGYIHEPFNINLHPGICNLKLDYWFTYICESNCNMIEESMGKILSFQTNIFNELKTNTNLKDLLYTTVKLLQLSYYRLMKLRPLLKDPIAIFSVEWLVKKFNMDVVVLIRHPAAFVSSLKVANMQHPFKDFLNQPLLMRDHLTLFKNEIEQFSNSKKDIVDQGILLWNIIHSVILRYKKKYKDWIFLKHEKISNNPSEQFKKLFNNLDLEFTDKIDKKIQLFSDERNPVEQHGGSQILRNSKLNIWNWKSRLSMDEIDKIYNHTHCISKSFYTDDEWESVV